MTDNNSKSVRWECVWSNSSGLQSIISMFEAFRQYPVLCTAAASLPNYSIHVYMSVVVRPCLCRVFNINKGRCEQKVSSKTPKVCVCVCAVHHVLTLMIEKSPSASCFQSVYVCVCVYVKCVCVAYLLVIA